MTDMDSWRGLLWPLTAVGSVLSVIFGSLGFLDPVIGFAMSTAGTWFPIGAVAGSQILPAIGYAEIGKRIALAAALLYVSVLLWRWIEAGARRLQERQQ